jgi:hypothetical protein
VKAVPSIITCFLELGWLKFRIIDLMGSILFGLKSLEISRFKALVDFFFFGKPLHLSSNVELIVRNVHESCYKELIDTYFTDLKSPEKNLELS